MFNDIKVGDKVAVVRLAGIRSWNTVQFAKRFVVHLTVDRTTKTQFIADGVRFKKDSGNEIKSGYGGEVARKIESTFSDYSVKYDLRTDQADEFNEYMSKANKAACKMKSARGLFNMENCKDIDDINKAHELLKKLAQIAPCR